MSLNLLKSCMGSQTLTVFAELGDGCGDGFHLSVVQYGLL